MTRSHIPVAVAALALVGALPLAGGCAGEAPGDGPEAASRLGVPAWAKDVVWYQIFVERFRNGDPSNDPTLADMEGSWPHMQPEGWAPTPWTQDWFRQEPWAVATGEPFYRTVQMRRYGGDLQGVLDRLDYLEELGVTALYLNPVNDAPSLHKYDARHYRHIDRNFGPDPRGDAARIATEDPADPSTWGWTAADSLFLTLVDEVHRRGMRIIVDYSWNHTGSTFWAWQDVLESQQASPYAGWYEIQRFDDPATPDTSEFSYSGWAGVPYLPELRKQGRPPGATRGAIEGTLVQPVRDHVFAVTRRWLDPNGDGDPSDGVDGFRLDVAEIVPLGFWREYRRYVRDINPEAYLVGEVWWEEWPDTMYDPTPWLQGDVFDAVMNYRWYMPTRSFFAGAPPDLTASRYAAHLDSLAGGIEAAHLQAMMNLTASHDTPRFGTSIYNPGRYKYRANVTGDPEYRIDRPDERTRRIQRLILAQQFTYLGAPHIWNGDEVGMWGGDDPDPRKPLVWADLQYEDEAAHPLGGSRRRDRVEPDTALRRVYRELIALRRQNLRLFVGGSLDWLVADDERGLLAYERALGERRAIVAFNASESPQTLTVPAEDGAWRVAFAVADPGEDPTGSVETARGGSLTASLPAHGARVWIRGPAGAGQADPARYLEMAREVHERLENVGYQIVVSDGGRTVLDGQFGFARLEDSVPVTADTRFLIMSVTKAFTAALLVKAASAGRVDLDRPVATYVPDYPPGSDPRMTLRALAAHTAGVVHFGHPERRALYVQHFPTAIAAIAAVRDSPLVHEPGSDYSYSSSHYNLIAAALEGVSGQSFPALLDSALLSPLGLADTELLDVQRPTPRLARNYTLFDLWTYADLDELQVVPTWDYSFNPAGGGMISTAGDLVRFGESFLEPGFFSATELELFHGPISSEPESPWSFGWLVGDTEWGTRRLRVSGGTQGVMASLYVLPDDGLVAAAIVNSWTRDAREGELVFAGVERILSAYLEDRRNARP